MDIVDSTCAALESDPETVALAATWAPMRDKADGLAKARLDSDRAATRARARLAVCDAKWDEAVVWHEHSEPARTADPDVDRALRASKSR